ncbi:MULTISPECIES: (2Fe-2S)-binding protein [Kangiella]|uniref:Bacterioferritin-associated ferredoxin n=2 Tax=Kangiella TaxID=261963 RepID=A0A318DBW1_9GAMM|nr:(2Fe-2S)-binding protein [Kangiella spongicola]PXF63619.1 (2Fe-2S)-binding protein [Kangiella spongicola]
MYVCLCKAVTDKAIKKAACEGACSMRCLNKMGVATQCGKCARDAKQILRATRAELDMQLNADSGRIAIHAA